MSIQNVHINVDDLLKLWEIKGVEFAASVFHESIINGTPIPNLEELGITTQKRTKPNHALPDIDIFEIDGISNDILELIKEDGKKGVDDLFNPT